MKEIIIGAAFVFLLSCHDKDVSPDKFNPSNFLVGRWLLYESGYSPGAGYIVEPVDPEPPQVITFSSNNRMLVTIVGLSEYTFYHILDDADQNRVLAFFKHDPGPSPDLSLSTHTYAILHDGTSLRLSFRYCIEGCHLALKKVNKPMSGKVHQIDNG